MGIFADFLAEAKSIDISQPTTSKDRRVVIEIQNEIDLGDISLRANSAFAGANEIQFLSANQATGGTFDITVGVRDGLIDKQIAVINIAFNASPATIQTAVDLAMSAALTSYVNGDVTITGGVSAAVAPITLTYSGESVSNTKHPLSTGDPANLTGSLATTVFSVGTSGQSARNVWAIFQAYSLVDFGGKPPIQGGSIPALTKIRDPAISRLSEPTLRRMALEAELIDKIPGLHDALIQAFFTSGIGDPTTQAVDFNLQGGIASTKNAIPNNFTKSGFGSPKAVLNAVMNTTNFGNLAGDNAINIGLADSIIEGTASASSEGGLDITNARSLKSNTDAIIQIDPGAGTAPFAAANMSLIADGCQYNWTVSNASVDLAMMNLMFGGPGLTAKVGHITQTLSHNVETFIGGLGFKPNALIMIATNAEGDSVEIVNNVFAMGFSDGAKEPNQGCVFMRDGNALDTTSVHQFVSDNRILFTYDGVEQFDIEIISMEDGGFKLRSTGSLNGDWTPDITYLALELPSATDVQVGFHNIPASSGEALVALNFKPRLILQLDSFHTVYNSLVNNHSFIGLSIMTEVQQICGNTGATNGVDISFHRTTMNTKAIKYVAPFASAIRFEGSFVGFTDDGYIIDYTTVDGTDRKGVHLAFR